MELLDHSEDMEVWVDGRSGVIYRINSGRIPKWKREGVGGEMYPLYLFEVHDLEKSRHDWIAQHLKWEVLDATSN